MATRRLVLAIALIALSARLHAGCATPSLLQLSPLETGHGDSEVPQIATGDVNRDGNLDFIVPSPVTDDVRVMLGNGDTTFQAYVSYPVTNPRLVLVRDLNNDQWPDIALVLDTAVAVLKNNGNGTFAPAQTYTWGLHLPQSIDAGDYNGDGFLDLLVTDLGAFAGDPNLRIGWNDGSGGFLARKEITINGLAFSAVSGFFNSDNLLDVALAYSTYTGEVGHLVVFIQDATGIPTTPTNDYTIAMNGQPTGSMMDLVAADFNNDNATDLAVSFYTGFAIYRQTAGGSFVVSGGATFDPSSLRAVAAGDINEDGNADLFFANQDFSDFVLFTGNGSGNVNFPPQYVHRTQSGSTYLPDVIINDVDHDGRPDVIITDGGTGDILILRNVCSSRYSRVVITTSPVSPSRYPADVTVTVTVTPRGGQVAPLGTVTLTSNNVAVGTAQLIANGTDGVATFTIPRPKPGTLTLRATYAGNELFGSQTATPVSHQILNPTFGAPLDVRATRFGTTSIRVEWVMTEGTQFNRVYRMSGGTFLPVADVSNASFYDDVPPNSTPQIYAVQSIGVEQPTPSASALSNADIATTFLYSSQIPTGGRVRAADILELRTQINGLRGNAGVPAFSFTDNVGSGLPIRAVHVNELRTALAQALTAAGVAAPVYTQPTITAGSTPIRAADILNIRNALE